MVLIHLCYLYLCLKCVLNIELDKGKIENRILLDNSITEGSTPNVHNDKLTSVSIKDIAYYIRNHKFNEWDRRYSEEKPRNDQIGFFANFPIPPLSSLHWMVKANCHYDFYECIGYLHSIVKTVPFLRIEDTAMLLKDNEPNFNEKTIQKLDYECKERHAYAQKIGLPFDDTLESYQWRTSASYYMCWYTMLGNPALSMIGEFCDNFANCLDTEFSGHNYDPRADDRFSFFCAMYSFCPDPCCPIKHIDSPMKCHNDIRNPCFVENFERGLNKRICRLDRKHNQNLKDIIGNKWNITCNCNNGYAWKSEYGMCVDVNECILGIHKCDITSQHCLNIPGSFHCVCKWGFRLDKNDKKCIKNNFTLYN